MYDDLRCFVRREQWKRVGIILIGVVAIGTALFVVFGNYR